MPKPNMEVKSNKTPEDEGKGKAVWLVCWRPNNVLNGSMCFALFSCNDFLKNSFISLKIVPAFVLLTGKFNYYLCNITSTRYLPHMWTTIPQVSSFKGHSFKALEFLVFHSFLLKHNILSPFSAVNGL